ncbi:hypothetical protein [Acetobacterium wieringae]|uniref:hypothetical protein n=1 Tax=Acetobacterium wieringae TaxID=52694 RepID=UPI0026EB26AF|nr:hypothetical protein [Acetobacterium wieringae]
MSTRFGNAKNRLGIGIEKYRLVIFMIGFILVKQLLVIGMPLFAHAGAGHDDRLMINMAHSLLQGEWLGSYSEKTLVKGLFFPLFLVTNDWFGIPYSLSIPGIYSLACVIFVFGIKRLFKTEFPLYLIFLALLFNPISFADETFLRVYRNSLTAAQVLIISGGMFAVYLNRFEKTAVQMFWAVIAGLGLAALWHTREDGIWIIPLVLGVIIITGVTIILKKELLIKEKLKKGMTTLVPMGILIVSTIIISCVNYAYYGIYTTNELNDSNFTKAIKLIYAVQPDEEVERASVPRSTMTKIYAVSPSLKSIKNELESSLDRWSWYEKDAEVRQVEDGFFFWALREAVSNSGYYSDAVTANRFYEAVANELEVAFDSGQLVRRPTMPSALMSPWRDEYGEKLASAFLKTARYVTGFEAVKTSMVDSIDDGQNGILLFEDITNNSARIKGEPIPLNVKVRLVLINCITAIYQSLGVMVFMVALVVYGLLTILLLIKKMHNQYELMDCWLVLSALLFSAVVLAGGVAYTDISAYVAISYWYLAGAYPLIIAFNVITLYKMMEVFVKMRYKREK